MANDSAAPVQALRLDLSSAAVSTAWSTIGTISSVTSVVEIYNSSLGTLQLGVGAGAYAIPYNIFPSGGNGRVGLNLDAGQVLAVRSVVNTTVSSGILMLNLLR